MKSRIAELMELLPPPAEPRNNVGDWAEVEADLGTALPSDYKEFTERYGTVKICDYFVVHTAFPWKEDFKQFLLTYHRQYDKVVMGRSKIPYPDYPAAGGLLPFAGTDSADVFSWITEGPPDEWGIFMWSYPGRTTFTFKELNLSGLLVDLLSMRSPLFPEEMPPTFFSEESRGLIVTD